MVPARFKSHVDIEFALLVLEGQKTSECLREFTKVLSQNF